MRRAGLSLGIVLAWAATASAQDDSLIQALALEETIQKVIARTEPSIACILVSRSDGYKKFDSMYGQREPGQLGGFEPPNQPHPFHRDSQLADLAKRLNLAAPETVPDSYGSGVVIDKTGLVLTNYHVVRDATKIFVRLPGKPGSYANIHAADERSDLAVLKLIAVRGNSDLTALPIADNVKTNKGQFVLSLANPYAAGFRDGSPSVSWGLLSNVQRRVPGEPNELDRRRPRLHYYGYLLQTDFRLNLGCSGGALVDLKGNWIGLTTAQAGLAGGESAGGFAIPLDHRIKRIIDVLREGREMEYGFLGITLRPGTDGVYIGRVSPNSPAARAGLFGDERVFEIEGHEIREPDDLFLNVAICPAGSDIRLKVQLGGERRIVKATLVKAWWPTAGPIIAAKRPPSIAGLRVDWTSTLVRGQTGDSTEISRGVVVRDVEPESAAARAGLRVDNIITEVNGRTVNTPKEFYEAAGKSGEIELTLPNSARKVKLP